MINAISSISSQPSIASSPLNTQNTQKQSDNFTALLNQALQPVREAQSAAQAESINLLTGQSTSMHQLVLASEKADLALQLTVQIRNKAMDAYNDIMRMQL